MPKTKAIFQPDPQAARYAWWAVWVTVGYNLLVLGCTVGLVLHFDTWWPLFLALAVRTPKYRFPQKVNVDKLPFLSDPLPKPPTPPPATDGNDQ